ncbi:MAG: Hsp70 family protein [Rikenellaceae bacterium]
METAKKVYGIDLGTTYSCIATIDEYGKAIVLKNSIGSDVTPSVVYYESQDNIVVGETAKDEVDPTRRISFIKRDIGNDNFVSKCVYPEDPVVVSSYILKKLVQDANEATMDNISDVVITCPAYFGTKEKMQTQQAGEIAGLNVLAILQEPTAAAISYGLNTKEDKTILVYDLGGGTFDVTIIKVSQSSIRTIVTGGDSRLGGADWDKEIVKYLAAQYENETGESDILSDPETEVNLYLLAEKAKKALSSKKLYKASVVHDGSSAKIEFTLETFESITANHLSRTISILQDVIQAAKDKVDADNNPVFDGTIDEVLLVGGSCRMLQVKSAVDSALGCDSKMFDPDQAVAKGAAMFAMFRKDYEIAQDEETTSGGEKKPRENRIGGDKQEEQTTVGGSTIINVLSRTYGIGSVKWCDENERVISTMVFEQSELPFSASSTFSTASEGQTSMRIDVYECVATKNDLIVDKDGSEEFSYPGIPADEGTLLDSATLEFGKAMPKGSSVTVSINVDTQGMMDVTAHEEETGKSILVNIKIQGVRTKEEVATAAARVSRVKVEG